MALESITTTTVAVSNANGVNAISTVVVGIVGPQGLSSSNYRAGIALTGTKNGVNKTFVIPESIVENSEQIFYNTPLLRNEGYTITGSTITLAADIPAPVATDKLWSIHLKSS